MRSIIAAIVLMIVAPTMAIAMELRAILLWQDNSSNEGGFLIERRIGSQVTAPFLEYARVGPEINNYGITLTRLNERQCFRVRSYNAAAISEPTNIRCMIVSESSPKQ